MSPALHRLVPAAVFPLAVLAAACGGAAAVDEGGSGDLAAMCGLMADIQGPEDVTVESLDALLGVAVDEVREPIQFIRDALAEDGVAAFEDPEVGTRFEQVGTFEGMECGEG